MSIYDGGPAFPTPRLDSIMGMRLRDYFAGHALAGLCANTAVVFGHHLGTEHPDDCKGSMSLAAYRIADAMIIASGRKEPDGNLP